MIEEKCQQVQDIVIKTKSDIFSDYQKQKLEQMEQAQKLSKHEERLNATINDAKFWLTSYTQSFKEHDLFMAGLKEQLNGRMDNVLT
jgi:hypothetical protein